MNICLQLFLKKINDVISVLCYKLSILDDEQLMS